MKDSKSPSRDVAETSAVYEINAVFDKEGVFLKRKECWENEEVYGRILKHMSHKRGGASRKLQCEQKHMQSDLYKNLDEGGHEWLRYNKDPKKASAIINMQEHIIETRF